jgi:hypothetical protein
MRPKIPDIKDPVEMPSFEISERNGEFCVPDRMIRVGRDIGPNEGDNGREEQREGATNNPFEESLKRLDHLDVSGKVRTGGVVWGSLLTSVHSDYPSRHRR